MRKLSSRLCTTVSSCYKQQPVFILVLIPTIINYRWLLRLVTIFLCFYVYIFFDRLYCNAITFMHRSGELQIFVILLSVISFERVSSHSIRWSTRTYMLWGIIRHTGGDKGTQRSIKVCLSRLSSIYICNVCIHCATLYHRLRNERPVVRDKNEPNALSWWSILITCSKPTV